MLRRLSHVCLGSSDLQRTIRFYNDLLGCSVAHEFHNDKGELYGVFLSCNNGTFLEFFNEPRPEPARGLFRHICFEVDDVEQMAARARTMGLACEIRRGRTDRILQFFVRDPDQTMIEFQQHDRESVLFRFVTEARRVR